MKVVTLKSIKLAQRLSDMELRMTKAVSSTFHVDTIGGQKLGIFTSMGLTMEEYRMLTSDAGYVQGDEVQVYSGKIKH